MKIKRDKIYHFIAGWVIYILTSALSVQFGFSLIWSYRMVIIIGAGKELVWDKYFKRGVPSMLDFTWTMIGGIVADLTFTAFWGLL